MTSPTFPIDVLMRQLVDRRLAAEPQEVMVVAAFDNGGRIRAISDVARGGFSSTHVHIPSVLRIVIMAGCDQFVVAHNHPSGDTEPSSEDDAFTARLSLAAAACDLTLGDHLIVAGNSAPFSYWGSGRLVTSEVVPAQVSR